MKSMNSVNTARIKVIAKTCPIGESFCCYPPYLSPPNREVKGAL